MNLLFLSAFAVLGSCNIDFEATHFDPNTPCTYGNDRVISFDTEPYCDDRTAGSIFKDQFSTEGDVPWMVSLKDTRYQTLRHFCAGIIISDNWILTTAFCVINYQLTDFKVVAGDSDFTFINGWEQIAEAKSVILHDEVSDNFQRYREADIALIQLKVPLNFNSKVYAAPLDNIKGNIVGEICITYGWGLVIEYGVMSPVLKKANLTVISGGECKSIYFWNNYLEQLSSICALSNFADGPCMGDWGGPLICMNQLVGIASWSNGCGSPLYPVVFVDIFKFKHWIRKIVGNYSIFDI